MTQEQWNDTCRGLSAAIVFLVLGAKAGLLVGLACYYVFSRVARYCSAK